MKRILIPYFSAGHGHLSFAKAIEYSLKKKDSGVEVRLFDPGAELPDQNLNKLFVDDWKKILQSPPLVRSLANSLGPIISNIFGPAMVNKSIGQAVPSAVNFLKEYRPSAIIPTHWGCGHLFSQARKKLREENTDFLDPLISYVYTELGGAYSFINCGADIYFVLSSDAAHDLSRFKVNPADMIQVGPVVQPEFQDQEPKELETLREKAQKEFGLDSDKLTMVFSLGGEGLGHAFDFLSHYYRHSNNENGTKKETVQVLALAGKNKALYEKIKELFPKNSERPTIIPLGYQKDLAKVNAVSDFNAGKCGTMWALESIWNKKPLLVCMFGGPNEKYNAQFIQQNGYGWYKAGKKRFTQFLDILANDRNEFNLAKDALNGTDSKNGAEQIAEYVLKNIK